MPGGRPNKLTPEIQEKIVAAVRAGNYIEPAAIRAGVTKDTLYEWLKRGGRAKRGIYREFSDALTRAEAEYEVREVAKLGEAADAGDVSARKWRLERRVPERWGPRQKNEISGPGGGPIEIAAMTMTPEERARRIEALMGPERAIAPPELNGHGAS